MDILNNIKDFAVIAVLAFDRELLYKLQYFNQRGRFPNLKHPEDISEHILSEMLKPSFPQRYADYADKIRVRQYVISKGLGNILLKHYGVWDDADKIDFEKLPDKFILKTNNGCGGYVFCRDKSTLNFKNSRKQIDKTLNLPYYFNKEPHYKAIEPLIFCEELIVTETDDLPTDYKFTCINGKPFDVFIATERSKKTKYCTFDMDWNFLDYTKRQYLPDKFPGRPKNLKQMMDIANILSQDFKFVRVDLYDTGDKVWFGELTFTPWGGLMRSYTDEAIKSMGRLYEK